jgi:hypothetical protein
VKVLSASAGGGSNTKPGFRGGGCHGRRRRARHRGGPPQPGTHLLYRRGGLPLRPRLTETGAGSKTSAAALGRGRARTDWWVLRCAAVDERGAPRGSPDFKTGLGARNALGRRSTSVGAGPGRRGRCGSGAVRRRPACNCVIVPCFERLKFQKNE